MWLTMAKEMAMTNRMLKFGAVLALLLASGGAYADDPTGVLLRERGLTPRSDGPLPEFSDFGPCQQGMQSYPFPNGQGYRCIRSR
jgi:hypothetical protein